LNIGQLHEIYSKIIINSLSHLGLNCSFSSPNSVLVEGKKICGAAAALGDNFVLWHGSILVSTDIQLLEEVLAPSKIPVTTRFVRSRWRPVTTIETASGGRVSLEEVKSNLVQSIERRFEAKLVHGTLSGEEESCLGALLSKYSSTRWNLQGNHCQAESKEGVE
jgi:lipoate-protein ligase A